MTTSPHPREPAASNSVRVLHVVAIPATAYFLLRRLIADQQRRGYQVEIACNKGEYLDELISLGLTVHVVRFSRRAITIEHFLALWDVYSLCRKRCFDVVHTHTPIASFLGRIAAKAARVKTIIYHMRGSWWESNCLAKSLFTLAEWIAGRCTDHIFTINCSDASDCRALSICSPESITCLHVGSAGLQMHSFPDDENRPRLRSASRSRLQIAEDEVVIGFVGRLVPEKGLAELVGAFRSLVLDGLRVRLLIVGGSLSSERSKDFWEELMAGVDRESGLPERILAVGLQKEVGPFIAAMDVLALPSYREGFGMTVAEAAAFAVPSVVTRTRGGLEAVVDGVTGLQIAIGSQTELAGALRTLTLDSELRSSMGRAARARALERFDQQQVTDRINGVYEQLLRRGR